MQPVVVCSSRLIEEDRGSFSPLSPSLRGAPLASVSCLQTITPFLAFTSPTPVRLTPLTSLTSSSLLPTLSSWPLYSLKVIVSGALASSIFLHLHHTSYLYPCMIVGFQHPQRCTTHDPHGCAVHTLTLKQHASSCSMTSLTMHFSHFSHSLLRSSVRK